MPKAAIDEHCNARTPEDHVRYTAQMSERALMDAIAQATTMQLATNRNLRAGVPTAVRAHDDAGCLA